MFCRRFAQARTGGHQLLGRSLQSRSFSQFSTTHRSPLKILRSQGDRSSARRSIAPSLSVAALPNSAAQGWRFNSTQAVAVKDQGQALPTNEAVNISTTTPDINDPFSHDFVASASSVGPGEIGYLHSLGLDFGWGPTSTMQWLIEHIHVWSDMPWWASIALSAVVLRTCLLPLNAMASDATARMKALQPFLAPHMNAMRKAAAEKDMATQMQVRAEVNRMYKVTGTKPTMSLIVIAQLPFAYGSFRLLRAMADLDEVGFSQGGTAWFTDLASSDPYFILPAISALMLHATARFANPQGMSQIGDTAKNIMIYGLPGISFIFTSFFPVALSLHFATTSMMGFTQAMLFRSETVRNMLGLYPLTTTTATEDAFRHKLNLSADAAAAMRKAEREAKAAAEKKDVSVPSLSDMSSFSPSQILSGTQKFDLKQIMQNQKDETAQKKAEEEREKWEQDLMRKAQGASYRPRHSEKPKKK